MRLTMSQEMSLQTYDIEYPILLTKIMENDLYHPIFMIEIISFSLQAKFARPTTGPILAYLFRPFCLFLIFATC